jgi:hypothetical protein|tara:strand:+ start:807 stop:1004 length:198 start_codon:yes stop_codon:yes gene_type:complete
MESKYTSFLAEISLTRYTELAPHCIKLEAKVQELTELYNESVAKVAELTKKLETKEKKIIKKEYE